MPRLAIGHGFVVFRTFSAWEFTSLPGVSPQAVTFRALGAAELSNRSLLKYIPGTDSQEVVSQLCKVRT
jgi:hypothetical protein